MAGKINMDWIERLQLGDKKDLWANFQTASGDEISAIEKTIRRTLPRDFCEFYARIGYGYWSSYGDIYSPGDITNALAAPVYWALGSLTPGSEWASPEEHRELWLTRGMVNPAPGKFTKESLTYNGLSLLDLLQIGSDGCCGYQMLHLSASSDIEFVLINDSLEIEFQTSSFREGITKMSDTALRIYLDID
jgi:hypothetical protein